MASFPFGHRKEKISKGNIFQMSTYIVMLLRMSKIFLEKAIITGAIQRFSANLSLTDPLYLNECPNRLVHTCASIRPSGFESMEFKP
jgi:hypothetical protein